MEEPHVKVKLIYSLHLEADFPHEFSSNIFLVDTKLLAPVERLEFLGSYISLAFNSTIRRLKGMAIKYNQKARNGIKRTILWRIRLRCHQNQNISFYKFEDIIESKTLRKTIKCIVGKFDIYMHIFIHTNLCVFLIFF